MNTLRKLADNNDTTSAAHALRLKRFALFRQFVADLPKPIKILDVGGTEAFWQRMGFSAAAEATVTLLNIAPMTTTLPNFQAVVADGCDLSQFRDREFAVVFSNSVIEHVPTREGQLRMAEEIRRVGKRYFVQTPNRYFPIEPHFLFPFFQFLPLPLKLFLLRHFRMGWAERSLSQEEALQQAGSIRLLTRGELKKLFPDAQVKTERLWGLAKSFIAVGGGTCSSLTALLVTAL